MSVPAQAPRASTAAIYRTVVGIALLCALLIVGVYEATAERIADNEARALRAAVSTVLPTANSLRALAPGPGGAALVDVDPSVSNLPAFVGYDASGNLVGAAITAAGMGYQDTIRLIYAYSFDEAAIVGMRVLQSLETPGLGDRIEKDAGFAANFERLDVSLNSAGDALLHPLEAVAQGTRDQPWQIDGITGATVSSKAVAAIMDASAGQWVPLLVRHRDMLTTAPEPEDQ